MENRYLASGAKRARNYLHEPYGEVDMDLAMALKRIRSRTGAEGAPAADPQQMNILEHLDELRRRVIRALYWLVGFFAVALIYANQILNFLKRPLVDALPKNLPATLYYTGPFDVFSAQIKVAFVFALVFGCPIWLYQLWKFIEPGLYPNEKRHIIPFTAISSLLFLTGAAFCYYALIPTMLHFLIELGAGVGTPIITITDYLSMVLMMLFAFGLLFETPLFLVILGLMGFITADQLSHHRRVIIVLILVLAAILTPSPDPISQITLAIPTYLLYEASIVAIRILTRRRKRGEITSIVPANISSTTLDDK